MLVEWNETAAEYPQDRCIHELFEEQVGADAGGGGGGVRGAAADATRELNARANQLAHYLRGLGVGPEVLVGLCVERSLEMVVGLLGILRRAGRTCRWIRSIRRSGWRSCWRTRRRRCC